MIDLFLNYFFDFMFPMFFILMFIFIFYKGFSQWNQNNHSPRLTVPATVITKRSNASHTHFHDDNNMHHPHTSYYITFQFESGDRSEFTVSGHEYGMLAEGDMGNLTFQGTRYLSFTRNY